MRKDNKDALIWRKSGTTDASGTVRMDLSGLGSSSIYVLKTNPFDTGSIFSEPISQSGNFRFVVGNLQVTVLDGANGSIIKDKKISVYEQMTNGNVQWRKSGETDKSGVIRFDLPGLGEGSTYIFEGKESL